VFVSCRPDLLGAVTPGLPTVNFSGDAEVKVVPDRVTLTFGVETRNKDLATASSQTDAAVKKVISTERQLGVKEEDIQTDFIHVDLSYDEHSRGTISFYPVTKSIQVVLKDVSKFEALLGGLRAGANRIDDVVFSTSELRKYRDQARAMAVKAVIEKAHDLATAGGFQIADKPLTVNASSGGGSFYSYGRTQGYFYNAQNAVQNAGGGGGGSQESVALGRISVSASVDMTFQILMMLARMRTGFIGRAPEGVCCR
jgi:uncharacterized protein YggE